MTVRVPRRGAPTCDSLEVGGMRVRVVAPGAPNLAGQRVATRCSAAPRRATALGRSPKGASISTAWAA